MQNDGAQTQWFGDENAVNTVADGIYHLGFAIENGRLLNEDGRPNASLKDVAYWLNELLATDLAPRHVGESGVAIRPRSHRIRRASFHETGWSWTRRAIKSKSHNHANFAFANGTIAVQFTADNVVGP